MITKAQLDKLKKWSSQYTLNPIDAKIQYQKKLHKKIKQMEKENEKLLSENMGSD